MSDIGLKYFTRRELADRENGVVKLAPARAGYPGFGGRLDLLREKWGKPLIVTSCCRSAERNAKVGGHPHSLHVYDKPFHPTGGTAACDFRLMGVTETESFKQLALSLDFSVADEVGCIHIDDRLLLLGLPKVRFTYTPKVPT